MREDEIALQRFEFIAIDARLGHEAEAGVDAVDRFAGGERFGDGLRRRIDRGVISAIERHTTRAAPDRAEVGEGEAFHAPPPPFPGLARSDKSGVHRGDALKPRAFERLGKWAPDFAFGKSGERWMEWRSIFIAMANPACSHARN